MTVRIVSNAVNAMVSGADDNVKRLVQEMLSYEVEAGDWKGTSTMFNWSKNAFPAGFAKIGSSQSGEGWHQMCPYSQRQGSGAW
ncbi:hypothetical protein QM084_26035 [Klebsiella pneumoniae]|uniref:hypothetical protein n=1 Tax=Klebsiella pneumoniae TaxID=573 RepID=UPI00294A2004|nr:hypothetical protein [Klebsiella pneumoniae]MDV5598696.1 hypothetical protein [Klebsiella pneumoniae]